MKKGCYLCSEFVLDESRRPCALCHKMKGGLGYWKFVNQCRKVAKNTSDGAWLDTMQRGRVVFYERGQLLNAKPNLFQRIRDTYNYWKLTKVAGNFYDIGIRQEPNE